MFSALKKILGIRTTNYSSTETPLFSGSAYFSNRVPSSISEKWVAHGGEIASGTTWDVRARYFFATDPSEPWVMKLFAKSVMVIHAGWIVHCIDEAFRVPIAEYILDDRFVPEPPYKSIDNSALPIYVPLSEPGECDDTESGESGPPSVQTSNVPSTPTSMPRKRKREQAYFDSPSGSLVFSGFDKDGMPRRPKKQRKLRFDPSFSPEGGRSGRKAVQWPGLDRLQGNHDTSKGSGEFSEGRGEDRGAGALHGYMTTVRSPDTPDRPLVANEWPSAACRRFFADEYPSKPTHASSPATTIEKQEKMPPIRTVDFTNLPPPRRRRCPEADATKSRDMGAVLSVMKSTDHKVKTPKKISFANHARLCVYMVSPRRPDTRVGVDTGCARQSLSEGFEDGLEADGKTRVSRDEVKGSDGSIAEGTKNLAPRTGSDPKNLGDDFARLPDVDQSENGTLTLTMEEVQAMRRRLLDSVAKNGVDNDQLAVLFELGKTYQGMAFRHAW